VFSVTVPVPPAVRDLADRLRPALSGFDRIRPSRTRTLVVKRLPAETRREYLEAARRAKAALGDVTPFQVRITGTGFFRDPPRGPGPVVYLAAESEGLRRAHDRLVAEFGAVDGLEGPDYVPHVTLARGGSRNAVNRLADRSIEPFEFSVTELHCYDSDRGERMEPIPLD
jgi:2'-5' RNA ligase